VTLPPSLYLHMTSMGLQYFSRPWQFWCRCPYSIHKLGPVEETLFAAWMSLRWILNLTYLHEKY